MSRKRLISPEFFTHGALYDAEASSGLPLRVAFAGLWTQTDRRGLFRWRPRELKLAVLPYDAVDFANVLAALEAAGFVERYVVDGKEYGRIPSFEKWQSFHKNERASDIPEPSTGRTKPANGRRSRPVTVTGTVAVTGTGTTSTPTPPHAADGGDEEEGRADSYPAEFVALWTLYPKRSGGNSQRAAFKAWKARTAAQRAAMRPGLERYAAFIRATGKEGTQYVMQGSTFFGPDEHWKEAWTVPALVIAPPRIGPHYVSATEEADRLHAKRVALEERYQAEAHRVGSKWAKEHPDEYAPIKALVDATYRGLSGDFVAPAVKADLTQRCARAAGFPPFDTWLSDQRLSA